MGDNDEVLRKLDGIAELLENLIILEAMKANIAGGSVRKLIGVDMNRVTQISKMLKAAKKG